VRRRILDDDQLSHSVAQLVGVRVDRFEKLPVAGRPADLDFHLRVADQQPSGLFEAPVLLGVD
jgi:hypothetical protein